MSVKPSMSAPELRKMESSTRAVADRARFASGHFLTPIGEEVVRRARLPFKRDAEDLKSVVPPSQDLTGRIRLGVLPQFGAYLFAISDASSHSEHPDLR